MACDPSLLKPIGPGTRAVVVGAGVRAAPRRGCCAPWEPRCACWKKRPNA